MLSTVESMLTTTPLRKPRDGLVPTPTMSRVPMDDHSAMTQQILVVPTSSPVMSCLPRDLPMPPPYLAAVLSTTWSRNRRSIDVAFCPEARSWASTPPSRPSLSFQSSLPSLTSTPSSM